MQIVPLKSDGSNAVIFELRDDVLLVCNNGEPFSIEGIESLMLPCYTSKSEREFSQVFRSSVINEQVQELLHERRQEYINNPKRIQSDYNSEYNTAGEYHGREILELIQNCIDAMPGDSTFQIGAKGLGFRSLLNWCERIEIYSGGLSVAFGLQEARCFRESLGRAQRVAILSAPAVIEPIALDYTTQIYLHLKKSVIEDVKAQLAQIDERSIVFLPKIDELIIRDDGFERIYRRLDDENGDVLVSAEVGGVESDYLWHVFRQKQKTAIFDDIDNEKKAYDYEIAIAFCEDMDRLSNNYLYSYFKTKVEFPVGWLCHADFELSTDRNTITNHPLNRQILRELVALIDDSSEKITGYIRNPEMALRSIFPTASLSADIAGLKFSEYYHTHIGRKKVLPTANGEFISVYDLPLLTKGVFPALFTGKAFSRFVKLAYDTELIAFIIKIARRENVSTDITTQIIQTAINSASHTWSFSDCLVVFEWWRKTYAATPNALDHLPNLIMLENGKWATGSDRVYFKSGRMPDVPRWVRFAFLSKDFQEAAFRFYNEDESYIAHKSLRVVQQVDERNISEYAGVGQRPFFRYLDRNSAISQVNISIGDNWGYACEFLEWLYNNYEDGTTWTPPMEVAFNFPSQSGSIVRPDRLYFGEYYGNDLARILAMQDGQEELLHVTLPPEDKDRFIHFVTKFGVRRIPARELVVFREGGIPKSYEDAIYRYTTYPFRLDERDVLLDDEPAMRREVRILSVTIETYKNLDTILTTASTSELMRWIEKDDFLKSSLASTSPYEKSQHSGMKAKRGRQWDGRTVRQIRNFTAHSFAIGKWVEIDGVRYSPNQVILDEKIGTQLAPHLIGKSISALFEGFAIEGYEINAIVGNLGFISDFSKIGPTTLYRLLGELSKNDVDVNGALSKKIYSQIMRASGLNNPNIDCPDRQRFIKTGKLYCYDGHFHDVRHVRYADKSYPERVLAGQPLIRLQKSRGAIKAERWFGTKEFKPEIMVRSFTESVYNARFQASFREVLKGLYVENRRDFTDENRWRDVKNMGITLASNVVLSFDNIEQPCDIYEYAINGTGQYVLMMGNIKPNPFDEKFVSALLEIVKAVIDIEDRALGDSFRELIKFPTAELRGALILRNDDEDTWQDADMFFDGAAMHDPISSTLAKNKALFAKCHGDNLGKFKRILYAKLANASLEEQKTYLVQIEKYKRIDPGEELLQDRHCNVLELLLSIPPAHLLIDDDVDIDVDVVGKSTKQQLCEAFPLDIDALNIFLSGVYDSLLRFGNYDYLLAAFAKHLKSKAADDIAADSPENGAGPVAKRPTFNDTSGTRLNHTKPIQRKNGVSHGGGGYVDYASRQAQNVSIGKASEKIVCDYLVGEYGKDAVKWVNQFAKEENVNLDGNDAEGYDIEYVKDGVRYCVEVKTNSSSLPVVSFNLTSAERAFAESHDNYQIFVVTAPRSDTPSIAAFLWADIQAFSNTPTGYWVEFEQGLSVSSKHRT